MLLDLIQTALLISTFVLMRNIEQHVSEVIQWFSDPGVSFPPPKLVNGSIDEDHQDNRTYLVKADQEITNNSRKNKKNI